MEPGPPPGRPAWVRVVAIVILLTLALPVVLAAVQLLRGEGASGPTQLGPVHGTGASDCVELVADPSFGDGARLMVELSGGGAMSCSIGVGPGSPVLVEPGLAGHSSLPGGQAVVPIVLWPRERWAVDLSMAGAGGC